jgi:hypothetical protein
MYVPYVVAAARKRSAPERGEASAFARRIIAAAKGFFPQNVRTRAESAAMHLQPSHSVPNIPFELQAATTLFHRKDARGPRDSTFTAM